MRLFFLIFFLFCFQLFLSFCFVFTPHPMLSGQPRPFWFGIFCGPAIFLHRSPQGDFGFLNPYPLPLFFFSLEKTFRFGLRSAVRSFEAVSLLGPPFFFQMSPFGFFFYSFSFDHPTPDSFECFFWSPYFLLFPDIPNGADVRFYPSPQGAALLNPLCSPCLLPFTYRQGFCFFFCGPSRFSFPSAPFLRCSLAPLKV